MMNKVPILILAGGLGTRLKALVPDIPKPMVAFRGKPFLEYQIEYVKNKGLDNIILCISHLRDSIIDYFKDGKEQGVSLRYSIEPQPLGTAGAIKKAAESFDLPDYFFVINGDTFVEWQPSKLLRVFLKTKSKIVLGLSRVSGRDVSRVETADDGKIIFYKEKALVASKAAKAAYSGAGVYVIARDLFKLWPEKRLSLEYDCIPRLVSQGRAYGLLLDSEVYDIGTPERLKVFERFLVSQRDGILSFRR
ncbi:MAG: NTP transferase domain-containing protein [Candidatus Omnitrophica bacterium]|nr:NTP transferase domain-containing protein [Candidatus Omnitrophota bacterium]